MSNGSVGHKEMQSPRSSPGHSELFDEDVVVLGRLVVVVGLPSPLKLNNQITYRKV